MRPSRWRWLLDEVFVRINGVQHDLWRAVDYEGAVLEAFVSKTRDKAAALGFLCKLMKRDGRPKELVTDGLRSYGAALKQLGVEDRQVTGRWENNRVENSNQPFRRWERAMLRFRRMRSLQTFAAVHSSVCNLFNTERSLSSRNTYKVARTAARAKWRALCAAQDAAHLPNSRRVRILLTAPSLVVEHDGEGFRIEGRCSVREISRDPTAVAAQACGAPHQYPGGFMLYCGTLFPPVEDRDAPGQGFTYRLGDRVTIAARAGCARQHRRPLDRDAALEHLEGDAQAQDRPAGAPLLAPLRCETSNIGLR